MTIPAMPQPTPTQPQLPKQGPQLNKPCHLPRKPLLLYKHSPLPTLPQSVTSSVQTMKSSTLYKLRPLPPTLSPSSEPDSPQISIRSSEGTDYDTYSSNDYTYKQQKITNLTATKIKNK